MKNCFFLLICLSSLNLFAQQTSIATTSVSPLGLYSNAWNDAKYKTCNTADLVTYMTADEKQVIYILNLIRVNPTLFANTVLKKYPVVSGKGYLVNDDFYYKSLIKTLLTLAPLQLLYPDENCYNSARCHAYSSGLRGYVGHERQSKTCKDKKSYHGECCDYGNSDPLEIVLSLLIDEGIPSLGHRLILLNSYSKVAVSTTPHKNYGTNTVIDFYY